MGLVQREIDTGIETSPQLVESLHVAREFAAKANLYEVLPSHMLLAMLSDDESSFLMEAYGVDFERTRALLLKHVERQPQKTSPEQPTVFSRGVEIIMEHARNEAVKNHLAEIDSNLVLAIMLSDERNEFSRLMQSFDLDISGVIQYLELREGKTIQIDPLPPLPKPRTPPTALGQSAQPPKTKPSQQTSTKNKVPSRSRLIQRKSEQVQAPQHEFDEDDDDNDDLSLSTLGVTMPSFLGKLRNKVETSPAADTEYDSEGEVGDDDDDDENNLKGAVSPDRVRQQAPQPGQPTPPQYSPPGTPSYPQWQTDETQGSQASDSEPKPSGDTESSSGLFRTPGASLFKAAASLASAAAPALSKTSTASNGQNEVAPTPASSPTGQRFVSPPPPLKPVQSESSSSHQPPDTDPIQRAAPATAPSTGSAAKPRPKPLSAPLAKPAGRPQTPNTSPTPTPQTPSVDQLVARSTAAPQRNGEANGMPMPSNRPAKRYRPPEHRPGSQDSLSATGSVLEKGRVHESVPKRMQVNIPSKAQVKITRAQLEGIAGEFSNHSAGHVHELVLTEAITVQLRAPGGGFHIENLSPQTQWIDHNQRHINDGDFGIWRWNVTPTKSGRSRLQLVISARTLGEDGNIHIADIPDKILNISVNRDYRIALKKTGIAVVAGVFGLLLGKYGESLYYYLSKIPTLLN